MTWTLAGHFRVDAAGWATGYTAALHNANAAEHTRWPVMMFATCGRIPDYKF